MTMGHLYLEYFVVILAKDASGRRGCTGRLTRHDGIVQMFMMSKRIHDMRGNNITLHFGGIHVRRKDG